MADDRGGESKPFTENPAVTRHEDDLSEDHRARRQAAHRQAAAAHEKAARYEIEVAEFMDNHDRPEAAEEHRRNAETDRIQAEQQRVIADQYVD